MSKGTLRQILLLTDGHSNRGEDPVAMAALAKEQGITVNVIGIVDEGHLGDEGIQEVEAIALAGGGVSQVVYSQQLAKTVQLVTRKAMTQTIQRVVNRELQQIFGEKHELEDLPPEKRGQVMEVVDDLGETMDLEVLILVDTSASMKNKLPMVQEALTDLSISLSSRIGSNRFSLYTFPGKKDEIERILDWTPKIGSLTGVFHKLTSSGVTPTGPAIKRAIHQFPATKERRGWLADDEFYEEAGM